MSSEFVKKMKDKFKEAALRRIEAWKESADAVVDEHHLTCPICFHVYTLAVEDCSMGVLQMPLPDGADPTYKANERPYPSCRSPVCEEKLCEPTDKDLAGDADQEQRPKTFKTFNPSTSRIDLILQSETRRRRMSLATQRSVLESAVPPPSSTRTTRLRRICRRKRSLILSEACNKNLSKEAIKMLPKFLPSTKMKKILIPREAAAMGSPSRYHARAIGISCDGSVSVHGIVVDVIDGRGLKGSQPIVLRETEARPEFREGDAPSDETSKRGSIVVASLSSASSFHSSTHTM